MTDPDDSRSPFHFAFLLLSVAGLAPLTIWAALSHPNYLAMALAAPFVALLAWSGTRVVRA